LATFLAIGVTVSTMETPRVVGAATVATTA